MSGVRGARQSSEGRTGPPDPLVSSACAPMSDEAWLAMVQSPMWARLDDVPGVAGVLGGGE